MQLVRLAFLSTACGIVVLAYVAYRVSLVLYPPPPPQPFSVKKSVLVGETDPAKVERQTLTEENLREYFEDGVTIVRGALSRDVVKKVLQKWGNASRNVQLRWWDNSDVLEMLTRSNLGYMAAQIFTSPNTASTDQPMESYVLQGALLPVSAVDHGGN
eukprot:gnl/TRDRNA2_/TRDRNA2_79981_c1_seq1.p1 gnl/TRDRNA2_/TRDRNA2_79981_c1~~gnl/TRDRNA2_/TRDRNA2_79981_c1_seq1.p1  ORF type:complete len:158 (+),score=25.57 gnl/TRDRNA2_/TRDRNA2_79981_c1_seq1:29-502(+)